MRRWSSQVPPRVGRLARHENSTTMTLLERRGEVEAWRQRFAAARLHALSQHPQVPDRPPRRDRLGGGDDGVGVDAVVTIEVGNRSRLAEMLDAKRAHAMALYGAEPGECRRMAVEHADDAAMGRQVGEQPLDMRARMHEAAFARTLCRGPSGIEPVRGGDGEKANVAAVFGDQPDGLDRFRCDRTRIGDDNLTIGTGL